MACSKCGGPSQTYGTYLTDQNDNTRRGGDLELCAMHAQEANKAEGVQLVAPGDSLDTVTKAP